MLDSVRGPLALSMALTPVQDLRKAEPVCAALLPRAPGCYKEGGVAAGMALEDLMMVEDMPVGVVLEGGAWPLLGLCFSCFLFSEGGLSS